MPSFKINRMLILGGLMSSVASVPVLPATLSIPFGAKTPALYGGYPVALTSAGTLTLTGTAATSFQVSTVVDENSLSWSMITPKIAITGLAGTAVTGTLTLGSSTCALTINVAANTWDVRPNGVTNGAEGTTAANSQLRTTWQSTSLALGDTIYLRDGDYNLAQGDLRVRRTTVPTGTWSGSNWAIVKGRTCPASALFSTSASFGARIRKITLEGNTVKNQYIRIEGVHFYRPNPGGTAGGALTFGSAGTSPIAFQSIYRCRFSSDESLNSTSGGSTATRHSAITGLAGAQDIYVQESYFVGLYDGVNIAGSNDSGTESRHYVEDNLFNKIWNDCCKLSNAHPIYIRRNAMINKKYGTGGLHGDFCQALNSGALAGSYAFGEVSNNFFFRGTGVSGQADGQGFFHTCDSPNRGVFGAAIRYTGAIVRNNIMLISSIRGVSLAQCDAPIVERNTVLTDYGGDFTTPGAAGIVFRDCGSGGNAPVCRRNILSAANASQETSADGAGVSSSGVYTTTLDKFNANSLSAIDAYCVSPVSGASSAALLASFPTISAVATAFAAESAAQLGDLTYAGRYTNAGAENAA